MASAEEHRDQAERNEDVAQLLVDSGFFDWAMTAMFYSALNLVQAYFVEHGISATSHGQRLLRILGTPDLVAIIDHYKLLKTRSESARYECRRFTANEYVETRARFFEPLQQHMQELMRS
jgi:hypothetical protein